MRSFRVREPAVEPVGLVEAKEHLRITTDDGDAEILRLVAAATRFLEDRTRRAFIDQGWRTVLDRWPGHEAVVLRPPPVAAIEAVTLFDAEGAGHALGAEGWRLAAGTGPALLTLGLVDPALAANGVEIDYACGYGSDPADVPSPLRHAILMLAGHWYEHREAAALGVAAAAVAFGIDALVAPYRVARL